MYVPNGVVGHVRVSSGHRGEDGSDLNVLWNLHIVEWHSELWWFVHILDANVHDGDVPEGALAEVARVQVGVGALNLQRVAPLALKVQALRDSPQTHS